MSKEAGTNFLYNFAFICHILGTWANHLLSWPELVQQELSDFPQRQDLLLGGKFQNAPHLGGTVTDG